MGRARISALKWFDYIEANPIVDITKTALELKISFNTMLSAVRRLFNAGILFQKNESSCNRTFYYKDYLDIL